MTPNKLLIPVGFSLNHFCVFIQGYRSQLLQLTSKFRTGKRTTFSRNYFLNSEARVAFCFWFAVQFLFQPKYFIKTYFFSMKYFSGKFGYRMQFCCFLYMLECISQNEILIQSVFNRKITNCSHRIYVNRMSLLAYF